MTIADPKISANKLAEYLVKKAARQRKILADRKYPDEDFSIGTYHRESLEAVTHFVAGGAVDTGIITNSLNILEQKDTSSIGTARRVNANIDALKKFEDMLDEIDLKGGEPELAPQKAENLVFYGVSISVRPEIILRGTGPKGKQLIGAIKFSMTTGFRHNEESAGYVSAMVQEHLKRSVIGDEIVYSPYCQVIDVGGQAIFPGVKSTLQRLRDIEAECQNIAVLWPSI